MGISKKNTGGWGNLGPVFRLAQFTFRYHLYKLARLLPEEIIHGVGMWFAEHFLARDKRVARRISASLEMLHPGRLSSAQKRVLTTHTIRFMGLLAFDVIFCFPNLTRAYLREHLSFENVHHFHAAVARGKGIIIPSIHLSQFFRGLVAVPLLAPEKRTFVIANVKNVALYSLPFLKHGIKIIPSKRLSTIRATLQRIVGDQDILIIAYDMGGRRHQLKVPFLDYLLPTPGSVVSLARRTGAMVLPVVMLPRDGYTRHVIRFLEPFFVEERGSQKATFGHYNARLNRLFAPFFRQYPFLWEEILGFATHRTRVTFTFPNGINKCQLAAMGVAFLTQLVETSWEPGRDDDLLLGLLDPLRELTAEVEDQFTYPFQSSRRVRSFTVQLSRRSVPAIFEDLVTFLRAFPAVTDQFPEAARERFRARIVEPAHSIAIDAACDEILAELRASSTRRRQ